MDVFSGLTELEVERVSDDADPDIAREEAAPSPLLDADTLAVTDQDPGGVHTYLISLDRTGLPTYTAASIQQRLSRGRLDRARKDALRSQVQDARQAELAVRRAGVVQQLQALGAEVTYECQSLSCVQVRMKAEDVPALAAVSGVTQISVDLKTGQDDGVDGKNTRRAVQLNQLIDNGFDGNIAPNTDVAQIELGVPWAGHVGFRTSLNGATRIWSRRNCKTNPCSSANSADETSHAVYVAGLLMGDLTDGQDPGFPGSGTSNQKQRSGYAGEAMLKSYAIGSDAEALERALDEIVGSGIRVVNMSKSLDGDPACNGRKTACKDFNEAYEQGVALFKSAGNKLNANTSDCTVGMPGAALGSFTVGAVLNSVAGDAASTRKAAIGTYSSRGGTATEGQGRSIISLVAPGCRGLYFDKAGGYAAGPADGGSDLPSDCGTSTATPTVAAAALDFASWHKAEEDDDIDLPGLLYANMLVMGDRQGESGFLTTGFDGLWGAGRLQARMFNDEGMDAPWEWASGVVCVEQGEAIYLTLNGGAAMSPDVGYVKAAIWWYDGRHDTSGTLDDINLRLQVKENGAWVSNAAWNSNSTTDNKEFVFVDDNASSINGKQARLRIHGATVTGSSSACSSSVPSMPVYYAYFYEDEDRDDADGPNDETIIAREDRKL